MLALLVPGVKMGGGESSSSLGPEIIDQGSINNYEPQSIAMPGTITVGGGFQL